MANRTTVSFSIESDIKPANFEDLLKFIHQTYIFPHRDRFTHIQRTVVNNIAILAFRLIDPETQGFVDVRVETGDPIQVEMKVSDERISQATLDKLQKDLTFEVRLFAEQLRLSSLYFAWVEGEKGIPERRSPRRRNLIHRLFSDSMLTFFVAFIAINIILFLFLGWFAVIVLIGFQFIMVLLSGKIIAKAADWQVTAENPYVHLFQYQLPYKEYVGFVRQYSPDLIAKLKQEIYQRTLAVGKPVKCETVENVLAQHGFPCTPENTSTKIVNLFEIVKTAATGFEVPIPKIVISNTVIPNAAASGPSPRFGVIVITTGLCAQLDDEELLGVIGHEFSHLKARDPLVLFGLTAGEFLLRILVFFNLGWMFYWVPFLFWGYLLVALSFVYFLAKILEARADLEAAIKIGQPKALADALRKIGFRKLQYERLPAYRIRGWTGWDPHPPLYFRISRLETMQDLEQVKHPLLRSIKDNIQGFFASLRHK